MGGSEWRLHASLSWRVLGHGMGSDVPPTCTPCWQGWGGAPASSCHMLTPREPQAPAHGGTARSRALPTDGGEPDRERGSCLPPPLGPSMVPSTFDFSYPQLTWVWWHRGALGRAPFPIAHAGGTGNNSLSTVLYGFQEGNKWPPVSPIFLLGSGTEP